MFSCKARRKIEVLPVSFNSRSGRIRSTPDDRLHTGKGGLGKEPAGIGLGLAEAKGDDLPLERREVMRIDAQGPNADADQKRQQVLIEGHLPADAHVLAGAPGGVGLESLPPQPPARRRKDTVTVHRTCEAGTRDMEPRKKRKR